MNAEYQRFTKPMEGSQYPSEYDFPSGEVQDLIQRDVAPFVVTTLDLSTAGSFLVRAPGRAFVPYFWNTGSAIKSRALNAILTAYINRQDSSDASAALQCKHNRGYRGSFAYIYVSWAAQPGVSVDFVVLKSKHTPWMTDGFTPTSSNSWGGPNNVVTVTASSTVAASTQVLLVNAAGATNQTLPSPAAFTGAITVKNIGAGSPTILPGAGTIDGGASYNLPNQYDSATFVSDGANIYVI